MEFDFLASNPSLATYFMISCFTFLKLKCVFVCVCVFEMKIVIVPSSQVFKGSKYDDTC